MATATDLTPDEWLARLGAKIANTERQNAVATWTRYYSGDHDLPIGPSQLTDAFTAFQRKARTNLCGICVRSVADRMELIGYRETDRTANDALWALMTRSRMNARQSAIWRKMLSTGYAYVVVGPDPRDPKRPRFSIEGAERVAVEVDPADPSVRLAAVRIWHDDVARRWLATIYTPGERHYRQSVRETRTRFLDPSTQAGSSLQLAATDWEVRGAGTERSTDDIPVIGFLNADEGDVPLAEFAGEGVDIQDRLNLSVLNRLTTERFQAYRQRGLLNFEPEEDPVTGRPIPPFRPGSDTIWTVPPARPGDPEPRFVDLPPSDTANILRACEADMRAFAAATVTPVYYLPGGDMINLSAEAIQALDSGHTGKVKTHIGRVTGPMADLWQISADIAGLAVEVNPAAIAWAKPESFHPAAVADYVSKLVAAQVPLPMVMEEIGWSPERIETLRAEQTAADLRASVLAQRAAAAAAAAQPGQQQAGQGGPQSAGSVPPRESTVGGGSGGGQQGRQGGAAAGAAGPAGGQPPRGAGSRAGAGRAA